MPIYTVADQYVATRFLLQHACEVLRRAAWRAVRVYGGFAGYLAGRCDSRIGFVT